MNATEAQRLTELALTERGRGNTDSALAIFERVIAARPHHNIALYQMGLAAEKKKDHGRALELLGRAVASNHPDPAPGAYHVAYANALGRSERHNEALAAADQAIELDGKNADAHFTRGAALRKLDRAPEAIASFEKALELKPDHFDALNSLGATLMDQPLPAQRRRAVELLEKAVAIKPRSVEAQCNRGNALRRIGKVVEGLAAFRSALDVRPNSAEAHNNLAIGLQETGDLAGAIACFQKAIALRGDYAEAHWNLGLALLHSGDFAGGWLEYEWRAAVKTDEMRDRQLIQPTWNGGPLQGRTILLRCEQGMGDTLQFVRYAQIMRQRGAKVILECQTKLGELMKDADGVDQVIERGQPLPPFDTHIRLMSLPSALGTTLETIPNNASYLHAQPQRVARWKEELSKFSGFKVGIAWQGNPSYAADIHRSIPLKMFAPLAAISGVRLFSLQKGVGLDQLEEVRSQFGVTEFTPPLDEQGAGAFLDTAAVMMNLDLVITSDTAVVHLAGALGVPVWAALARNPDWRWMNERADSPWYPKMRLFRQKEAGNWSEVFSRMASELAARVGAPAPVRYLSVPISPGELVDRITILEIKMRRIIDPEKLKSVKIEFAALRQVASANLPTSSKLEELTAQLSEVNQALWEIEDALRVHEKNNEHSEEFIALARAVFYTNDRRAAIKKEINVLLGAEFTDEKSYPEYGSSDSNAKMG